MATKLCIGLNQVALLRSSRTSHPDLVDLAAALHAHGCTAVRVDVRPEPHAVRPEDVLSLAALEAVQQGRLELHVGGDAREALVALVLRAGHVHTCVLASPEPRASSAAGLRGFSADDDQARLHALAHKLHGHTRVRVFCEPSREAIELAAAAGASSVELDCCAYAAAFDTSAMHGELTRLYQAERFARACGLGVGAARDLGLAQVRVLCEHVPLDEIAVGHAFVAEALLAGAPAVLPSFLQATRTP